MSYCKSRVNSKLFRKHGRTKPARPASSNRSERFAKTKVAVVETPVEQVIAPYDESLLEPARSQWQFGDWKSLAILNRDILRHHPDRGKLALLSAAGQLQLGNNSEAKKIIRLAQGWGVSKKLISQILISRVHHSLGRAYLAKGEDKHALYHFEEAIRIVRPTANRRLLAEARMVRKTS